MRSHAFRLGGADAKDADNVDKEDSVEIVRDDGDADADADDDADDDDMDDDDDHDDADDADAAATAAADKEVIDAMSCPDDGAEENIPVPGTGIGTMQFAWRWDRPGSVVDEVEWRRLHISIEPPGRCRCR